MHITEVKALLTGALSLAQKLEATIRDMRERMDSTLAPQGGVQAELPKFDVQCFGCEDRPSAPSPAPAVHSIDSRPFVLALSREEIEALASYHDQQQEDANSMEAECYGNDLRAKELRAALTAPAVQPEATQVGSISKAHLKAQPGPWCKEILLYSPDNQGDYPEDRVMLFALAKSVQPTEAVAELVEALQARAVQIVEWHRNDYNRQQIDPIVADIKRGLEGYAVLAKHGQPQGGSNG